MNNVLNLINYNIDTQIDKLQNSLDTNKTLAHVTNPTLALLDMLKQYLDFHRQLIKPFDNLYQTTNDNSILKLTINNFIQAITDDIQHNLQQSYYHHANLNLNFNDLIIKHINHLV